MLFFFISYFSLGQNIPKEILSIDEFPNHILYFNNRNINKEEKKKLNCYLSFIKNENHETKEIIFIIHDYVLDEKRISEYLKMKNKILQYFFSRDDKMLKLRHRYIYGKEKKRKNINDWYFEIQLIYEFKNIKGEKSKGIYDFNRCE